MRPVDDTHVRIHLAWMQALHAEHLADEARLKAQHLLHQIVALEAASREALSHAGSETA
jgi:hypothetical protein